VPSKFCCRSDVQLATEYGSDSVVVMQHVPDRSCDPNVLHDRLSERYEVLDDVHSQKYTTVREVLAHSSDVEDVSLITLDRLHYAIPRVASRDVHTEKFFKKVCTFFQSML